MVAGAVAAGLLLHDETGTLVADPVGVEVYERACSECHGPRGAGVERFGPALDAEQIVLRFPTAAEEVDYILQGGDGGKPRFAGRLDRAAVAAAADLTRLGLDSLGPLREETDIDGAELFAFACSGCHGARGQGAAGPRLAGGAAVERFPDIEDQMTWVRFGGNDMPAFNMSMSTAQIRAVVEYTRTEL